MRIEVPLGPEALRVLESKQSSCLGFRVYGGSFPLEGKQLLENLPRSESHRPEVGKIETNKRRKGLVV